MDIEIFGDSHVAVLRKSHEKFSALDGWDGFACDFTFTHGRNLGDFNLQEVGGRLNLHSVRVPKLPPFEYTIDPARAVHFFCSPMHSAPFYRHPAWKAWTPWNVPLESRPLVPAAAIHAWVDSRLLRRFELLDRMLRLGARVAVIEPPKPLYRAPQRFGIPPEVIVGVDRIVREHVIRRLGAMGVPVVTVPPQTHENGLTPPAFASSNEHDPHHGNLAFGRRMLRQILVHAKSMGAGPHNRTAAPA